MSEEAGGTPGGGRPLRVALRTADPVRRAGLASLLRGAGYAVVEAAAEGEVLLADLAEGESPPAEAAEGRPVLVLSDDEAVGRDTGLAGVLPRRETAPVRLDAALRAVAAGLLVRAPEAPPPRPARGGGGFAALGEEPSPSLLTPREVEILGLVGEGLSNKAVARRLGISAHTVKFHLESIFAKLGAASRAEAVARGLRGGVIEL